MVAGQVGEVFVEVAVFSIFIETLRSDWPLCLQNLYDMKNVPMRATNTPNPMSIHFCESINERIGDLLTILIGSVLLMKLVSFNWIFFTSKRTYPRKSTFFQIIRLVLQK